MSQFYKIYNPILIYTIHGIFHTIFESGVYPEQSPKCMINVPLNKIGDVTDVTNYRESVY